MHVLLIINTNSIYLHSTAVYKGIPTTRIYKFTLYNNKKISNCRDTLCIYTL